MQGGGGHFLKGVESNDPPCEYRMTFTAHNFLHVKETGKKPRTLAQIAHPLHAFRSNGSIDHFALKLAYSSTEFRKFFRSDTPGPTLRAGKGGQKQ